MAHAKQPISEREFNKIWKEQLLPKFMKYVDTSKIEESAKKVSAGQSIKDLEHFLEKELPSEIYAVSAKQELRPTQPGAIKLLETMVSVGRTIQGRGYGKLVPYLIQLIQPSVAVMYQKNLENSVDRISKSVGFDVEKWVEDHTGLKLNSTPKEEVKSATTEPVAKTGSIADLATGGNKS